MGRRISFGVAALLVLLLPFAPAQNEASKDALPLSPSARLAAAKTAFLKNAGGSEVPFDVITEGVRGWGRYQIVSAPEKADIIIEVTSPGIGSGVSVTSTTSTDARSGMPVESATSSRELQVARITLIVYDAKSKMALWSSSEQPKGALRHKNRQDKVVETAQHLVTKFRERVEPDSSK
jgi:hypothetical protein